MPDTHIVELLEEKPFQSLSGDEMIGVESHIAYCEECRRAYNAARIAASLIQARASEVVEVPPFFKTRVMAALRETRTAADEPALIRIWRAAGAMVSAMAVLMMVLVALTIFTRSPEAPASKTLAFASQSLYSPEYVVFESGDANDEVGNDQMIETIYDPEDGDGQ